MAASETTYQSKIEALTEELHKYKTNNQRWQQLMSDWSREKSQLTTHQAALAERIQRLEDDKTILQSQIAVQQEKLQEKEARILELNRLHTTVQQNLEHYRESAREQRAQEKTQHDAQLQAWQMQIKTYQEQMQLMQQSLLEREKLIEAMQRSEIQLKQQVTELSATVKQQQVSLHEFQQYNQILQHAMEKKSQQLLDTQTEYNMLKKEVLTLKERDKEHLEKNKLIQQEKLALSKKLSQLESKLKQHA